MNVEQYASDKDARWGAKSKNKYWFGYKRREAVDMRFGLVKKVVATSTNVLDFEMAKNLVPKEGAVFAPTRCTIRKRLMACFAREVLTLQRSERTPTEKRTKILIDDVPHSYAP